MIRGNKHLRIAQVITLSVATIMMVAIVAVALSANDALEDWGVEWSEPATMTVDSVSVDEGEQSLVIVFHLWDAKEQATEWSGQLVLQMADENFDMVYENHMWVSSDDFTTVRVDDWVDTYYMLSIPFDHLSHITDEMRTTPDMDVSIRATFTFGQQTLTAERWWWPAPTHVKVEAFYIVEDEGWILYDIYLFDDMWRSSKWSGDLRIIVRDSNGAEMYNRSEAIFAADFNMIAWGDVGWAWYRGWVLFEDVHPSTDRIAEEGDNGSGCWMRVLAEFRYEGVWLKQDPDGHTAIKNTQTIPDALLMQNEPPTVRLTADRFGMTGREHQFDASGTRDDLGTEGLVYEWSWGDGTLIERTSDPVVRHTFARAGSFDVELRVIDIEGASSEVEVPVMVVQDPRVDVEDVGNGELADNLIDSYPLEKLRELRR
jgi:hypothetical protein